MINYNRLGYEIKRDLTNFSEKISKGNYRMDYMDKHGKKIECKISYIPVQLCEFPNKNLVLVVVYGFRVQPMLLLTSLTDKRLGVSIILKKCYR